MSDITMFAEDRLFRGILLYDVSSLEVFWLMVNVTIALFWIDENDSAGNAMSIRSTWGF